MPLNQFVADDFIAHAIDLERFTAGERKRALKVLKQLETNLVNEIRAAGFDEVKRTAFKEARLEKLLTQTRATIGTAYKRINKDHRAAMKELATLEGDLARGLVNQNIGVDVLSVATSPAQLKRIIDDTLIDGAPSRDWWSRQGNDLQRRFADNMRQGVLLGETNQELAQRVRGTRRFGFNNGIMQAKRYQADALVRSSVQTVANKARKDVYAANADVVKGIEQLSTLDTKTTNVCKAYDRKVWTQTVAPDGSITYTPDGHSLPYISTDRQGQTHEGPPRHWNCRSTIIPVVKSWEELKATKIPTPEGGTAKNIETLFRSQLKKKGKSKSQIDAAVRNARASMDGSVAKETDYTQWLNRQVATGKEGRAVEALGRTRYDMWREGLITDATDLVDQSGRELTLDELFEKYGRPKGKPTPKPKPPEPPVITPQPVEPPKMVYPANEPASALEWHQKSWIPNETPQDIKDIVAKVEPLKGGVKVDLPKDGAFFQPAGDYIHMRSTGWSSSPATWRHEYGHHIDYIIAQRNKVGHKGFFHQGSSDYWFSHVRHDDANLNKIATVHREYNDHKYELLRAVDIQDTDAERFRLIDNWLNANKSLNAFNEAREQFPKLDLWNEPRLLAQVAHDFVNSKRKKVTAAFIKEATERNATLPQAHGAFVSKVGREGGDPFFKGEASLDDMRDALARVMAEEGTPINTDDLFALIGKQPQTAQDIREAARVAEAISGRNAQTFASTLKEAIGAKTQAQRKFEAYWDDYIGSITNNKLAYGHENSYYAERVASYRDEAGNLVGKFSTGRTGESFANWISLRSWDEGRGVASQKLIEWFTPNTHRAYTEMTKKYIIDWSG